MKKENWLKSKNIDDYNNSSNIFFDENVQNSIIEFVSNKELSKYKRNLIFEKKIKPAMEELISIIINRFKFVNTGEHKENLEVEVLTKTYEVLEKSRIHLDENKYYNESKGSSYSYFSRVVKNYLIQKQDKYQKTQKKINVTPFDNSGVTDYLEIDNEILDIEKLDLEDFISQMCKWFKNNLNNLFVKSEDKMICIAIIEILDNKSVNFENKSECIFMIVQHNYYQTYKINYVINIMKEKFFKLKNYYIDYYNIPKNLKI